MVHASDGYFLLIDAPREAVISKLSTSGIKHIGKSLDSGESNWRGITRLAKSEDCMAVVAVLRERTYRRLAPGASSVDEDLVLASIDQDVVNEMLSAVAAKPHLVLVHEAVIGGAAIYEGVVSQDVEEAYEDWNDSIAREHFGDIDEGIRVGANERLGAAGISTTPYKRNAEASMLSVAFIEDQHSNLLFRLYVPAGRLFEDESADLLRLFHQWLTSVRGKNVRQGGYKTARGRVIEFFAESASDVSDLHGEMHRFQRFLSIVENPSEAEPLLIGLGLDQQRAASVVSEFARRMRRIQLDVKYERERRGIEIRHELESILVDELPNQSGVAIAAAVDLLLPSGISIGETSTAVAPQSRPSLTINQQIIGHVDGIVAQNLTGGVVQQGRASELQKLIMLHANVSEKTSLLDSLQELLDTSAPSVGRLSARQKLKRFLLAVGDRAGQVGTNVLQSWLESQLGF